MRYDFAHSWVSSLPKDHLWLADFDRPAYCRPLIWQAKKLGRKTATLVHGSPNQNYLPPVADQVLVWGDSQLRWFRAASPQSHCHVVGRPEIRKSVAPAPPRRLRVMHSMERLSETERESLVRLCAAATGWGLKCSIRPHPSLSGADLDDDWKAIAGSFRIEDGSDFWESLIPGDIVVGINSTALIDALTIGVPALTLADSERELPCDLDNLREASIPLRAALLRFEREPALERSGADILTHPGLLEVAPLLVAATGTKAAGLVRDTVAGMVA
ncbi:hypothetical protein ACFWIX_02400 [Pseudarthrobacter sp. NPDC058362]|uniref:hypothetical protein n=1 Tax=Pseudarthrobacter sp. NPDC058362 TaxID=3346458 RepID=UPI00364E58F1